MTDITDHDDMEYEEESFADMLDSYSPGLNQDVQVGDKISGKIISIGLETVFVDVGSKIDGVVEKLELLDDDQNLPYQTGDDITLYVTAIDESEIRLSKAISGIGGLNLLKDAHDKGVPVEGKVKESIKGGFSVEMLQRKAFCPISQIDMKFVEKPEDYVGMTLQFLIVRFEENGRNIVLSRRALLEAEAKVARKAFFDDLSVGGVISGRVTKLMPYGAFVEVIPGVEGMVHISELCWTRVENPREVLKEGEEVRAKVIGVEENKKTGRHKLSLSIKQALEDPWLGAENQFKTGDKINGKVTRLAKFGAFVEIAPGIEGMVHLSEMSYHKRVLKPEEVVQTGDVVSVMVKDVDSNTRRISLSIKETEGDPWVDVAEKYEVGKPVVGTLEKQEAFGLFISLEPGVTGLMPKSNISKSADAKSIEKLKNGEPITVIVEAIDGRSRRITLAPGDSDSEKDWKNYSVDTESPMGDLGDKLKAALKQDKK